MKESDDDDDDDDEIWEELLLIRGTTDMNLQNPVVGVNKETFPESTSTE